MEIGISLSEYLDQIKQEYDLPDNMTYKQIISYLEKEVSVREKILKKLQEKVSELNIIFGEPYSLKGLDISSFLSFKLVYHYGSSLEVFAFFEVVKEHKLMYFLDANIEAVDNQLYIVFTLDRSKFENIKGYL